jgi:hypothetical protein
VLSPKSEPGLHAARLLRYRSLKIKNKVYAKIAVTGVTV